MAEREQDGERALGAVAMRTNGRGAYTTATWLWHWQHADLAFQRLTPAGRRGLYVAMLPEILDGPWLRFLKTLGPLVSRHPIGSDVVYVVAEPLSEPPTRTPDAEVAR